MTATEPKILFVCTGNTCRSPMAAGLFKRMLREGGIPVQAESAGLAAAAGEPAAANAVTAAAEHGADLSAHRARQVDAALVAASSAVYTMTPAHLRTLEAMFPAQRGKFHVLGHGIPDPFGGGIDVYRKCRDAIEAALVPLTREMKNRGED